MYDRRDRDLPPEAVEARRRAAVPSPALRLHIWRRRFHTWCEGPGAKWFDARLIPWMPPSVTAPVETHPAIRWVVMARARWQHRPAAVQVVRRQRRRKTRRRR